MMLNVQLLTGSRFLAWMMICSVL